MAYGTVNADVIQTSTSGGVLGAGNASIMKNRLINGAFVIDQRNAGASVNNDTGGTQYTLDRWFIYGTQASKFSVQQNAGSVTPPVGFSNYFGATSLSAYSVGSTDFFNIIQRIEGFNTADLNWGTANAKTVTLSFWVRSSLTGTFGGVLLNGAADRSYPYSYTISSANTWEQKSVTIAGDTSGTWVGSTNGTGMQVRFGMGSGATYTTTANAWASGFYNQPTGSVNVVGTNGATFYITGVQLEVGSSATGFEYRLYNQELSACQRYFEKSYNQNEAVGASGVLAFRVYVTPFVGNEYSASLYFKVSKRTAPTMAYYTNGGTPNVWVALPSASNRTPTTNTVGENSFEISVASVTADSTLQGSWTASAEL